jgi:hypothetical protein
MKEYKYQEQGWDNEILNDFMSDDGGEEEDSKYYDPYDDPSYRLLYGGHMSNETGMLIGAVIFAIIVGVPAITLLVFALLL